MEQHLCFEKEALQNLTTKAVDRQRVLEDIHLDLLRRIRDHKVKHLQKKILRMLQEYHIRKTKVHEELLIAVHKKHEVKKIKEKTEREIKIKMQMKSLGYDEIAITIMEHFGDEALQKLTTKAVDRQRVLEDIHLDLLRRIRDHKVKHLQKKILRMLGEYHQRKTKLHEELLIVVHKKEVKKVKEKTEREIKTYQIEKQENYEEFVPRKLFLFGVESFRSKPKEVQDCRQTAPQHQKEDSSEDVEDKADICQSAEENQPKEDKAKTKSMISRVKRFLGMK